MGTAEALVLNLGPAPAVWHSGSFAARWAAAPVTVLASLDAENRAGLARVSRIAKANSGPKLRFPHRGVLAVVFSQEEGRRSGLHHGTHQVHV